MPRRLARAGLRDMVRVSDARMSGTAYGTVVLHCAPEAAVGGPLALVRDGDLIELEFPVAITVRRPHRRVKSVRGRVALTRGPLVYCLESVDNPGLDIFEAQIDPSTLRAAFSPDHLGGVWLLQGETVQGEPFTAIPYFCWANRGESGMTVWARA